MTESLRKELLILIALLAVFVGVRSLYFADHVNFSTDQAAFSLKSLELWRAKKLTLIGPSISFHYIGRDLYQGSLTYYLQLLFMLSGGFEPILSSYFFMIFAVVMIVPLYYGVKILIGQSAAFFVVVVYGLLPFYIDYSRFFWNPNFQLAMTPILIWLMGLFHRHQKRLIFFLVALAAGVLLLFHYQFIVVVIGLGVYYFLVRRLAPVYLFYFLTGVVLGFSPTLIFELRNNFYNFQTLILYLAHLSEMAAEKGGFSLNYHYFLSLSLLAVVLLACWLHKSLTHRLNIGLFLALLLSALVLYARKPARAFGMAPNWNYPLEKKVNAIIRRQNLKNYNVVNLGYDTVATVQKYLLQKDNVAGDFDDYYQNRYLFVISPIKDFMDNPAYEVNTFTPSRQLKTWPINSVYKLYLLERTKTEGR